jgi:hydrogenase maturation factor HypF (carbamoyltransferase family)
MAFASAGQTRLRILVRGAVQGVGFRPFVYRQATALGLAGWVSNSGAGVALEVEGDGGALSVFVDAIRESPPPNATAVAIRIGQKSVILTGGCFQNARLTEATVAALRDAGCEPVWHQRVPPNDGGLALGQAVWAAWIEQRSQTSCA